VAFVKHILVNQQVLQSPMQPMLMILRYVDFFMLCSLFQWGFAYLGGGLDFFMPRQEPRVPHWLRQGWYQHNFYFQKMGEVITPNYLQ